MICMEKLVKVDGKTRTDPCFPAGFMDVIELPKAGQQFRLVFDPKGRYKLHAISDEEKKYKLCKVVQMQYTLKKIPYIVTHDGRTIRYPDPLIKVGDTVKVDIATGKITDFQKFELHKTVMVTKGRSTGRVGAITKIEKHPGSFDIATIKDSTGAAFSTRLDNVFVIGSGDNLDITLPKGKGIKLSILGEREMIERKKASSSA